MKFGFFPFSLPILIGPDINVTVDAQPGTLNEGEKAHHAVTLHVAKMFHQLGG